MTDEEQAERPKLALPPMQMDDWRILLALPVLEDEFSTLPTLADAASAAGLTPFHFHRRFLETMGETVGDYSRRIRLQRAAAMVTRTTASLLDTAQRSGYASQEAFTRAFARHYDMTPGALRRATFGLAPPSRPIDRDRAALVRPEWSERQSLIGMRFYGDYRNVPLFWQIFAKKLQAHGFALDRAQAIGVLHDDPGFTDPGRIRYDCCILDWGVPEHLVRAPFWRTPMQESLYARTQLQGGYDDVAATIFSICVAWLAGARKFLSETPAYEIYRSPPWARVDWFDMTLLVPIS